MKNIICNMLKIYVPSSGLDWMNYKLVREDLSFHHIVKKSDGGNKEISNGALLQSTNSHPYLHLIEYIDVETYKKINEILKEVNKGRKEPSLEQRYEIEFILQRFEKEHKWDKNSKGDLLVRRKYLNRW